MIRNNLHGGDDDGHDDDGHDDDADGDYDDDDDVDSDGYGSANEDLALEVHIDIENNEKREVVVDIGFYFKPLYF